MPRRSHDPDADWSVVIFRVSDAHRQQQVLHRFRHTARVGVTALGTMSGHDAFVVVECSGTADEVYVRRVVLGLDPGAVRTLRSARPGLAGPLVVT